MLANAQAKANVQAAWLGAEERLHLQNGPIDLVIEIDADAAARRTAFTAAVRAFDGLLEGLVAELDLLRTELPPEVVTQNTHTTHNTGQHGEPLEHFSGKSLVGLPDFSGVVARQMLLACAPYRQFRITPMAAVAGSVADFVLRCIVAAAPVRRAWVNNGGDIAIHLAPNEVFDCAIVTNPHDYDALAGQPLQCHVKAQQGVAGIATSGRHGRSLSLGIADSVTVLAPSAAAADAAATLIANHVDLPGHSAIERERADSLDVDSDLADRLVVTHVGQLSLTDVTQALSTGYSFARQLQAGNLITGAILTLQGRQLQIGLAEQLPARNAGGPVELHIGEPRIAYLNLVLLNLVLLNLVLLNLNVQQRNQKPQPAAVKRMAPLALRLHRIEGNHFVKNDERKL